MPRPLVPASLVVLLSLRPAAAGAQAAPQEYLERYRELMALRPDSRSMMTVRNLVVGDSAVRLTFDSGQVALLSPVGGRPAGLAFRGTGHMRFAPPPGPEMGQLAAWAHATALTDTFTSVVLLAADSTVDRLALQPLGAGTGVEDMTDDVHRLVSALKGEEDGAWNAATAEPFLNGQHTAMRAALIERRHGGPVLLVDDPGLADNVALYQPVSRALWGRSWAALVEFADPDTLTAPVWRYRDRLVVGAYRIDAKLTEAFNANLNLAGAATLTLRAAQPVGPWLRFGLDPRLDADSVAWGGTAGAAFFKAHNDGTLWVRSPRRLAAGDTASVTVYYHGQMIDRWGNFFYVEPGGAWYPQTRQGSGRGTFDITFHSPERYPLVAIGERRETSVADRVTTSRWVTTVPTELATFNLGLFDSYKIHYADAPEINVMMSDAAHAALRQAVSGMGGMMTQQSNMRENVAVDVSNALRVFTHLFGPPPDSEFTVTEIPYAEGVSFPGLIDLSWGTFQATSLDGFDEWFRAHETAHQWWGNGVRPASYRDAWLSEGLASFCALWFLRFEPRRAQAADRFLDSYRRDIQDFQNSGSIAIGYRAGTPGHPGYQALTYEKGAWVFQMLRMMMMDIGTMNADRFTGMMKDFYAAYRGRDVSTADFRSFVEGAAGVPMGWFFDQWVNGDAIPTYHVAWRSEPTDDGRFRVHFRIRQEGVPAEFRMPVLVAADLGNHQVGHFHVRVSGAQTDYVSPPLPAPIQSIVFGDQHSLLADVKMEGW